MATKPLSKPELKELAHKVIVPQGNFFIKELLRRSGAMIGATKEDFATNLDRAIDASVITQEALESWLAEVEGWGDQHIYMVEPPRIDTAALTVGLATSPYASLLDVVANLDFPDTLELNHIRLDALGLSMVWHERKKGWNRWKTKDFSVDERGERYRFDAYRQRFDRSIVRYEWRFADPYCAILIRRNTEIDHEAVFVAIRAALAAIGCPNVCFVPKPLSHAVKVVAAKVKGVHSTRFESDGGYVAMASTLPEGGIDSVESVRVVLKAVDMSQFKRAEATLHFAAEEHGTSRRLAVQVYGSAGRIRIWAQCKREDVYQILQLLWGYNCEP